MTLFEKTYFYPISIFNEHDMDVICGNRRASDAVRRLLVLPESADIRNTMRGLICESEDMDRTDVGYQTPVPRKAQARIPTPTSTQKTPRMAVQKIYTFLNSTVRQLENNLSRFPLDFERIGRSIEPLIQSCKDKLEAMAEAGTLVNFQNIIREFDSQCKTAVVSNINMSGMDETVKTQLLGRIDKFFTKHSDDLILIFDLLTA